MWTIFFATLSVLLLFALMFVWLRLQSASAGCKPNSFESPLTLLTGKPQSPRYAQRWSDETIVKFSRRYQTLRDNEI